LESFTVSLKEDAEGSSKDFEDQGFMLPPLNWRKWK
jgi:hypothetical protein